LGRKSGRRGRLLHRDGPITGRPQVANRLPTCPTSASESMQGSRVPGKCERCAHFMGFRGPKAHSNRPGVPIAHGQLSSFIHYSTPVYPGSIQVNNLPHITSISGAESSRRAKHRR
jgi:hypothetical protein